MEMEKEEEEFALFGEAATAAPLEQRDCLLFLHRIRREAVALLPLSFDKLCGGSQDARGKWLSSESQRERAARREKTHTRSNKFDV